MSFDASALPGWVVDEKVPGLAHADGVAWWAAPVPRRWWHRCRARTMGLMLAPDVYATRGVSMGELYVLFAGRPTPCPGTLVQRCACGAIRLGAGRWHNRNQRPRSRS